MERAQQLPFRMFSFSASAVSSVTRPLSDDMHVEPGYHVAAPPLDYVLIGAASLVTLKMAFDAWGRSR